MQKKQRPQRPIVVRSGRRSYEGRFIGEEGKPFAFVWEEADPAPQTIVIMPDYAGAYAWRSGSIRLGDAFPGDPSVLALVPEFERWQALFEVGCSPTDSSSFDWMSFHKQGVELARRLKAVVGGRGDIIYRKPYEDSSWREFGDREIDL